MSNQKLQILSFIGVMFLVGLLFTGFGGYLAIRAVGAGSWESTKGTITRSVVGSKVERSVRLKKGSGMQTKQSIAVEYEYLVEGESFFNDQISFDRQSSNIDKLNAVSKKYSKGSTATVHYSPSNPQNSVLDNSFPVRAIIFLLLGIVLLVGGGFAVPLAKRQLAT